MRGNVHAGACGERIAAEYLRLCGYEIMERNFRCGRREIDIIAMKDGCMVFVEVKTRRGQGFGGAACSVGPGKISNMRKAAMTYLSKGGGAGVCGELRFDVIAIDIDCLRGGMELGHFRGVS